MRYITALAVALAVLAGSGCAYLWRPTQDQIGSTHVGVLSVMELTPELSCELQPQFALDPEQALGKVAPVTLRVSETRSTALSAVAAAGSVEQASTAPKAAVTPEVQVTSVTIEAPIDPMSRYAAATSLYQEVKLLSRYVENATTRSSHTAYVVRLQVALLPRLRAEPYDAYVNIAFFSNDHAASKAAADVSSCAYAAAVSSVSYPNPHAVPLFVTDNMELTSRSWDETHSREAAFALAPLRDAMVTMAGGMLGFGDRRSRAESGAERNSRLTVTRLSDNSLRVRLGAAHRAKAGYVMEAQNHAITLLLLVPQELMKAARPEIQVMTHASFVHAYSGHAVARRPSKKVMRQLEKMAQVLQLGPAQGGCGSGDAPKDAAVALASLVSLAQKNDYPLFKRRFAEMWPEKARGEFAPNVFTALLGVLPGGDFYAASFEVPELKSARKPAVAVKCPKPAAAPKTTQDTGSKKSDGAGR